MLTNHAPNSFLATKMVKVADFMLFDVTYLNGFEIGVCVDIAGRRLSIRATETDTNEGVLSFYHFFGLVVLFIPHYFCVSHRKFVLFFPQLVGCLI